MTDNTLTELPLIGSRWTLKEGVAEVSKLAKRGKGWQVWVLFENAIAVPMRLADFRKQAKPAGDA